MSHVSAVWCMRAYVCALALALDFVFMTIYVTILNKKKKIQLQINQDRLPSEHHAITILSKNGDYGYIVTCVSDTVIIIFTQPISVLLIQSFSVRRRTIRNQTAITTVNINAMQQVGTEEPLVIFRQPMSDKKRPYIYIVVFVARAHAHTVQKINLYSFDYDENRCESR